jgi:hypothetical protein
VRSRRFPRRSEKEMNLKGEEVTVTPCEGLRKRKCQRVRGETEPRAEGVRKEKWHREEELMSEKGTVAQEGGSATRRKSGKRTVKKAEKWNVGPGQ